MTKRSVPDTLFRNSVPEIRFGEIAHNEVQIERLSGPMWMILEVFVSIHVLTSPHDSRIAQSRAEEAIFSSMILNVCLGVDWSSKFPLAFACANTRRQPSLSFRRYTCGGGPKRTREIGIDSVMWFAVGVRVGTSVDGWTSKDAGNRLLQTPHMEWTRKLRKSSSFEHSTAAPNIARTNRGEDRNTC